MLQLLAAIAIALVPFVVVAGLLVVAERVQRRRERVKAGSDDGEQPGPDRRLSLIFQPVHYPMPARLCQAKLLVIRNRRQTPDHISRFVENVCSAVLSH